MGEAIEGFDRLCPDDVRAKKDMPSAAAIIKGISYALEPGDLNKAFRSMNLRNPWCEDKYLAVSYNEMVAGIIQLLFEQAYEAEKMLKEK